MNAVTAEWVARAEEDYALAVLARKSKRPLNNGICFHCQQCAEKYLKARLVEAGFAVPKTHNLPSLLDRVLPNEEVKESLAYCRAFRRRARASLGLASSQRKRKTAVRQRKAAQ